MKCNEFQVYTAFYALIMLIYAYLCLFLTYFLLGLHFFKYHKICSTIKFLCIFMLFYIFRALHILPFVFYCSGHFERSIYIVTLYTALYSAHFGATAIVSYRPAISVFDLFLVSKIHFKIFYKFFLVIYIFFQCRL